MKYLKNHKTIVYVFGGAIIFLAIVVPRVFKTGISIDSSKEYRPLVSILSVNDYIGDIRQIDTEATVESKGQVEIKAQISAPVQSVNVGIGDRVYAGQTLLILKSDDTSAQVSQARANLASAEARLLDAKKGTRVEELAIYEQQFKNAERDMNNAMRDAYTKIEDAARNKTDILFRNGGTVNPEIIVRTESQPAQRSINEKRILLTEKLRDWKTNLLSDETVTLAKEQKVSEIISFAKSYFDDLAYIVNDLTFSNSGIPQATIDGYRSSVSSAQMQINSSSAAYSASVSVWKVASDNFALRKAGSTSEQLALAEASVAQAQAALQGAQAVYSKAVIMSPIDGIVSILPFRLGDLVSPGNIIAGVVNGDGLELKAYVSEDDTPYVKEGDKVLISNRHNANVSRIAPSVDPLAKKVELKISVGDKNANLIVGSIVHVKIFVNSVKESSTATSTTATSTDIVYTLPISSVNISNSGSFVYTIASSSDSDSIEKVTAHKVVTGEVSGENIRIISGIEANMKIVMPVIGLKDGSSIRIREQ